MTRIVGGFVVGESILVIVLYIRRLYAAFDSVKFCGVMYAVSVA
jgi:hypothetical protein